MREKTQFPIEAEAARALVLWKEWFSDEVSRMARQLAIESGESPTVTLTHYRQAAGMVIPVLSETVQRGEDGNVSQEAA